MRFAPALALLVAWGLTGLVTSDLALGAYEMSYPAGVIFEGDAVAALAGHSGASVGLVSLALHADRLHVYEGIREYAVVQAGDTPVGFSPTSARRTYELTDVTVTLSGDGARGFVGFHFGEAVQGWLNASEPVSVESRNQTVLNSEDASAGQTRTAEGAEESPDSQHAYLQTLDAPHLYVEAPGHYRAQGAMRIKIHGPSLRLQAAENETTLATGMRDEEGLPVRTAQRRWVVLEGENVTLEATSDAPWKLAFSEVRTPGAILRPDGAQMRPALAAPLPEAAPATGSGEATLLPFLLAGAVLAGGGGALALWRWRAHPVPSAAQDAKEAWDAEDCVRRAEFHLQAERLDRALQWLAKARDLAPTSVVACTLQAFVLERLGRVDEALAGYSEAARLAQDGEPALCAARLAASSGRAADEVEVLLADALTRSPAFVEEVDGEAVFRRLRGRPLFESAVGLAWTAHLSHLSGDEG